MKYLLDTNIFMFLLNKATIRLSKKQAAIIENPANELFISEASLYEIAIKTRMGKPDFSHITMEKVAKFRKKIGIKVLGTKLKHYEKIVNIPKILKTDGKPHADPFDLLIIATAETENLPILSSDEYFPEYLSIETV